MTLSDLSIKNSVFAVMLAAAMLVFGSLAFSELGISQFPEIDFPVVNITTFREAADPETMDFDVTDIVEDAVSSVEGIDYIQSQSLEGVSVTTVYFRIDRKIDVAMQDVQNAVGGAMSRLPNDIDPPVISKVNFNKFPVMWLAIHGHKPVKELNDFVDNHLKQRIETIPGVGGIMYGGLRKRNMRLWLDGEKLHSFQLDALDVMKAVTNEHRERPAGYLQQSLREQNLRVMGEARDAEEFRRMAVVNRGGQIIRVGDVAVVEDGLEDRRGFARFNREPNVGVGVMRAEGANVVQVCNEIKKRLPELRKIMPPGTEISISTDYSLFIVDDIQELQEAMFYGILLTAFVAYLFLGSIGTTLNVCLSIPTSLIGTLVVVRMCGFTLNFMTLLALSLSVGVVVDDAIMVLENIYRRREHGEPILSAALQGAREISFAAIAATLSIAAIFIPVAFMKGSIGLMFYQFGITVTVAVLLSLVISLTITPMLCSRFLVVRQMRRPCPKPHGGVLGPVLTLWFRAYWVVDRFVLEPVLLRPMDWLMDWLARVYSRVLKVSLRRQWWVVPASVLLAASALLFVMGLRIPLPESIAKATGTPAIAIKPIGKELVPSEDQNRFIVNVICPVGCSIDYVDEMLGHGENIIINMKDPVHGTDVAAGVYCSVSIRPGALISEGVMFVRLVPQDKRTLTQTQVMNAVRQGFAGVPGVRAVALDLSTQGFTPQRGYPVDFAIQGPQWDKVIQFSERIRERMIDSGVVSDVLSDYRPGMPEVHVVPDRVKAAQLGIPIQRLAFTINVAFGGTRNGRFTDHDKRYDVRLRYLETQRSSPDMLDKVYVKTSSGKLVPLKDVTKVRTVSTLPILYRYNHMRKIEVTANMAPGVTQGAAIARCQQIAEEVREELGLPTSYRVLQLGNAKAMRETIASLWWALALGFVVAYMILGVQFNSFVHPFTVLLAVPFGVTGGLMVLWLFNDTINIMSMIGMVLLAGLVKKNSIILVDYTNILREQGMSMEQAVLEACPVRLRPILMTSFATMAAAVPQAMGYGAGAETRAPLARSIIGGLLLSTAVTLVIVPVFYILFDRFGTWVRGLTRRETRREETVVAVAFAGSGVPSHVFVPSALPNQDSTLVLPTSNGSNGAGHAEAVQESPKEGA